MKRLRLERWGGQLLHARSGALASPCRQPLANSIRRRQESTAAAAAASHNIVNDLPTIEEPSGPLPSPSPQRAAQSAKLAALHARLSLSKKIPLETLARALIVPSADTHPNFNNENLATLGRSILNYHVLEYLVCKYPRLPMAILYEALRAYAGRESLNHVARRWGVESAAAPGEEVDPGLLQWKPDVPDTTKTSWGYSRPESALADTYQARRGLSSRVVMDDDFGDTIDTPSNKLDFAQVQIRAFSSFVQAVIGAIYTHCGREAAKTFVASHILSRQVSVADMFQFDLPTRELAMLCAREGFQPPMARLESETGRQSRTPVYVVGIYSGTEKLGEGSGPSLNIGRWKACMNTLKAWYLYSPGNKVRVPSDMMEEGAKRWKAPHIDLGEII